MALVTAQPAPDFSLIDTDGNLVKLADLRGIWVVLYFYPRDNTPGCTKEACGFRDIFAELKRRNVIVLGVSADDTKSHKKFSEKLSLPFPLLSDPDAQVATAYESFGPKKFMGKEFTGIYRNTFLIDPEGNIAKIYQKVKPETHPTQILADINSLSA
ncbi:thioredoxin-dependent thiol peroxidase [Thermosynechococcaceae cyanobacterium BACA0444]|uniref:thioredoxin-dependent peroxiredoxin n=1 Tax=Pseudocalidococcus azoricus BACA0444 TaxID=2918990 RepID=A0AAE4FVF4_9CYAN|nr:thioredoxin-dependent thiol peroxidase [Pseudocalidococcus azoricus]MDS3862007.1 thioredoxin-dependent thiol peroxidase [Pseudocalidococcus azoricus BACA0444]